MLDDGPWFSAFGFGLACALLLLAGIAIMGWPDGDDVPIEMPPLVAPNGSPY
jgi:hypothetical protein